MAEAAHAAGLDPTGKIGVGPFKTQYDAAYYLGASLEQRTREKSGGAP
jgi:hypothetical protein